MRFSHEILHRCCTYSVMLAKEKTILMNFELAYHICAVCIITFFLLFTDIFSLNLERTRTLSKLPINLEKRDIDSPIMCSFFTYFFSTYELEQSNFAKMVLH